MAAQGRHFARVRGLAHAACDGAAKDLCLGMFLALVAVLGSAATAWAASPASCTPVTFAIDTSYADTTGEAYASAFWGRSYGQVFSAQDTLIASVTFWLPPRDLTTSESVQFFLAPVDSTGRPVPFTSLYEGPVSNVHVSNGTDPVPVRFFFDPPLALPHPGKYCVAFHSSCPGAFSLLARLSNPYPDGMAWLIGATWNCVGLGAARNEDPNADLNLAIGFCQTTTPVRRRSWGDLKTHYR